MVHEAHDAQGSEKVKSEAIHPLLFTRSVKEGGLLFAQTIKTKTPRKGSFCYQY